MIITVKNFEDKTNNEGAWYAITDERGKVRQLFNRKIADLEAKREFLQPGMTVDLELRAEGKYKGSDGQMYPNWIVTDVKPSTAAAAVNADKSGTFAEASIRQRSIERQNALTNAVNMWAALGKSFDPTVLEDEILKTADRFYAHTSGNDNTPSPTETYSFKTQFDYEQSVKKLGNELGFKTISDLNKFILHNSPMLPNTAWKSYDDGLKGILIALLAKEVENKNG